MLMPSHRDKKYCWGSLNLSRNKDSSNLVPKFTLWQMRRWKVSNVCWSQVMWKQLRGLLRMLVKPRCTFLLVTSYKTKTGTMIPTSWKQLSLSTRRRKHLNRWRISMTHALKLKSMSIATTKRLLARWRKRNGSLIWAQLQTSKRSRVCSTSALNT